MNRKILNIVLLFIFIVSIISFSVNAAFGDIFRTGLTPIEDFFRGGWQNYEKTVAFVVFFFLFFSAYLIGIKNSKVFGDKLTRAPMTFAFAAAFLSAFIIAVSTPFDWVNLAYVAWFLIGVLILFALYSLFSKLFGKHKFWAFLLALLLTLLLLWLIWYLMHEGMPLAGFGRIRDRFARFGKKPKLEAGPPIVPEERPPGREEEEEAGVGVTPPVRREGRGKVWLWILIIGCLAVGPGIYGMVRYRQRGLRGGFVEGYRDVGRAVKSIISFLIDRCRRLINRMHEQAEQGNTQGVDNTTQEIENSVNDIQAAARGRGDELNEAREESK